MDKGEEGCPGPTRGDANEARALLCVYRMQWWFLANARNATWWSCAESGRYSCTKWARRRSSPSTRQYWPTFVCTTRRWLMCCMPTTWQELITIRHRPPICSSSAGRPTSTCTRTKRVWRNGSRTTRCATSTSLERSSDKRRSPSDPCSRKCHALKIPHLSRWSHWGWCHPGRRLMASPLFLVIALAKSDDIFLDVVSLPLPNSDVVYPVFYLNSATKTNTTP